MKKRKAMSALLATVLAVAGTSAALAEESTVTVEPTFSYGSYTQPLLTVENSETILALQQESEQKGTVVTLDYTAPAYGVNALLGEDLTIDKTVSVYLPYGYDESKQYDVLYLLHGTGGDNEYWLTKEKTGVPTVNVVDNMIAQGLCEPLIIVCPDWNAELGKKHRPTDEQITAWAEANNDPYPSSRNDVWVCYFVEELRNDIMPLVESTYSTYAAKDVSEESLTASREHRAIAGLSRGSMAVARAGLISSRDRFAWFGCYSGIWSDVEQFVAAQNDAYPVRFWYNGNGTADFSYENHITFLNEVMAAQPDTWVDGENFALVVKEGSEHSYENWLTDLYNTLILFF